MCATMLHFPQSQRLPHHTAVCRIVLLLVSLSALSSSSAAALDIEWLSTRTAQIIRGCQETVLPAGHHRLGNATNAYTPDATHSYGAQWTRDFQYAVSGAAALMNETDVKASVYYTFAGQRSDGCMPDRSDKSASLRNLRT